MTATVLANENAASAKLSSVRHWPWEALKGSRKANVSKRLTPSRIDEIGAGGLLQADGIN